MMLNNSLPTLMVAEVWLRRIFAYVILCVRQISQIQPKMDFFVTATSL